ncbi:MAG: hypothetical protein HS116_05265 [Planctomycetes bacterium]|nr:hypothetical protein [Planctomycetota bacterium]
MDSATVIPPELSALLDSFRTDPARLAATLLQGADPGYNIERDETLHSQFLFAALAVLDSMEKPDAELLDRVLHELLWETDAPDYFKSANWPRLIRLRGDRQDEQALARLGYALFLAARGQHREAVDALTLALRYWAAHDNGGYGGDEDTLAILDTAHKAGVDTTEAHRLWTACGERWEKECENTRERMLKDGTLVFVDGRVEKCLEAMRPMAAVLATSAAARDDLRRGLANVYGMLLGVEPLTEEWQAAALVSLERLAEASEDADLARMMRPFRRDHNKQLRAMAGKAVRA